TFTWAVAQAASSNPPAPTNPTPNPQPLPPAAGSPLVGAIRHDDWDPDNPVTGFAQLSRLENDTAIRYRLPYHATVASPSHTDVNENAQAVIDQDILYASDAGIDYWVIGHACTWGQYTYQRMKASPYRSRMKYALMETSPNQCRVDQL